MRVTKQHAEHGPELAYSQTGYTGLGSRETRKACNLPNTYYMIAWMFNCAHEKHSFTRN